MWLPLLELAQLKFVRTLIIGAAYSIVIVFKDRIMDDYLGGIVTNYDHTFHKFASRGYGTGL